MKIVFEDTFSLLFSDIIITNLNSVISKSIAKKLTAEDYEMIIAHLEFYRDLLKEANNNGKNN